MLRTIAVTSTQTPEPTASKRDLNAFLVAMSVALHWHSMYPSDHPSIGPGIEDVFRRASELLAERSTIAYLQERAGTEFDPDMVTAFLQMLREGEARVRVLTDDATASPSVEQAEPPLRQT